MNFILHPVTSFLLGITLITMVILVKNNVIDVKKMWPLRNITDQRNYYKVLFFHAYTSGCLFIILSFTMNFKMKNLDASIAVIIIMEYVIYRIRIKKFYN